MNWLEISIGIIFLICIITGLIRGAVRIIVSLVATIVTLVIVFFATPYVSQTIEKYTPLDDMIRQKVVSTMADAAKSAVSGGDSYSDKGGLTEEAVKKVLKAAGVSEEKLESYGISIADIVSGKLNILCKQKEIPISDLFEDLGREEKARSGDRTAGAKQHAGMVQKLRFSQKP